MSNNLAKFRDTGANLIMTRTVHGESARYTPKIFRSGELKSTWEEDGVISCVVCAAAARIEEARHEKFSCIFVCYQARLSKQDTVHTLTAAAQAPPTSSLQKPDTFILSAISR